MAASKILYCLLVSTGLGGVGEEALSLLEVEAEGEVVGVEVADPFFLDGLGLLVLGLACSRGLLEEDFLRMVLMVMS